MFQVEIRQSQGNRLVAVEKPEIIIGRPGGARLVDVDLTPDDSVSRAHARVFIAHGAVFIEDLKSSTGTSVNGEPLHQVRSLREEDLVQVGESVLRVFATLPEQTAPVPQPVVRGGGGGAELPAGGLKLAFEVKHKGKRSAVVVAKSEATIGRKHAEQAVDVDLSEDSSVSRVHARVWCENGELWVEDRGSRHGTVLNGTPISGPSKISKMDIVQIGETQLHVQLLVPGPAQAKRVAPPKAPAETSPLPDSKPEVSAAVDGPCPVFKVEDFVSLSPSAPATEGEPLGHIQVVARFARMAELEVNTINKQKTLGYYRTLLLAPRDLGGTADFDALCASGANLLLTVLPAAERSALFLAEVSQRRLVLKAHVPGLKPFVSAALARETIARGHGVCWKKAGAATDVRLPACCGMYAPICMGNEPVGLLTVDSAKKDFEYALEDLCFFMQYAQLLGAFLRARAPRP